MKAIVWAEGDPDTAQVATNILRLIWLQWCIGIKTYWPNPGHAKRVSTYWPAEDDPFGDLEPSVIAYALDDYHG